MKRKSVIVLFLFLSIPFLAILPGNKRAVSSDKPRVAVLTLEGRNTQEETEAIAEELRQQFVNSGRYTVIDRTLNSKITEEWSTQQSGLTDEEKAIRVGKLFNVQMILTGKLNKFSGGGWQISVVMIDAQTGVAKIAGTVRYRGDFFTLLDVKVPQLAQKLLLGSHDTPAVRALPTPPAVLAAAIATAPGTTFRLTGEWTEKSSMTHGRYYHSSVVVDGRLYVFGGEGDDGALNLVEMYEPKSGKWRDIASMTAPRSHATAVVLEGKIYLIGGKNDSEVLSRVDVFDPVTESWSPGAPIPLARAASVSAVIAGKIYVIGGFTQDKDTTGQVDAFDPASNRWIGKASMLHPRSYATAETIDGNIYVIAGSESLTSGLSYLDVYDAKKNRWASLPEIPRGRFKLASAVAQGKIYVFGGLTGNFLMNSPYGRFDAFDPAANKWDESMNLPTGIFGHTAAAIDGRIYLIGGLPNRRSSSLMELR